MILTAAAAPDMVEKAKAAGAAGIKICGLCCTGNELLGRQGVPMAGNHLMTELAIVTGAVEAVVVDYQCIMPSMVQAAACYHTRFITTSEKAKFTGAVHVPFDITTAYEQACEIVDMAIAAYENRVFFQGGCPRNPCGYCGRFFPTKPCFRLSAVVFSLFWTRLSPVKSGDLPLSSGATIPGSSMIL